MHKKSKIKKRSKRLVNSATPVAVKSREIAEPISVIADAPEGMPSIDAWPPWRSMAEASRYLLVSRMTIYRYCHTGKLHSYVMGGLRRIPSSEIKAMMGLAERVPLKKKATPFEPLCLSPWAMVPKAERKRASVAA